MTPVKRRDLAVLALGLAVATWLVVDAVYGSLPDLRWWLPAPIGVLAVAEALGTRTLRARLAELRSARAAGRRRGQDDVRPGERAAEPAPLARPVEPMLVARLAVLAQASAYVGAVFVGVWLGVFAYVAPQAGRLQAAGGDLVAAVVGVVCSAGLIAAALWLESACRVPPDGDEPPLTPHA
jgi:Protein of unknown function (DUF3180)